MSNSRDGFMALSVALSARIAIDTLLGFTTGDLWHGTEDGVKVMAETRLALRYTYGLDSAGKFYNQKLDHFKSYDEMMILRTVVEEMKWKTWNTDLEQWLNNIDQVKAYYSYLESYALGEARHAGGGCF